MTVVRASEVSARQIAEYLAERITPTLKTMTQCCLTCDHWNNEDHKINPNSCALVKRLPPPRVIAYGCEQWQEVIPF